ncbi:MAG: hypothetical protein JNL24_15215, partial [Bacteroidia bacterium]|nr:hypothetical protein [Bacteroidia bacterium]
ALFLVVLLTSSTIALNVIGVNVISEAHAAVSEEQVYQYLTDRGYQVLSIRRGSTQRVMSTWYADTIKNGIRYTTTVYCNENEIIGHGDMPF